MTDPTDRPKRFVRPPRRIPGPYDDAAMIPDAEVVAIPSLVTGTTYEIEIGPGRGGFIFERAAHCPDLGILGLEVRRKWAAIVDRRLASQGFGARARVFADDAKEALTRLGPDGSVRVIYLHFPDPWWKKRHEKRLVLDLSVLDPIVRLLGADGDLFVQTDVAERAEQYEALLRADARFVPAGDVPGDPHLLENPYEARSPRERRAIADGLPIHRLRFRKRAT